MSKRTTQKYNTWKARKLFPCDEEFDSYYQFSSEVHERSKRTRRNDISKEIAKEEKEILESSKHVENKFSDFDAMTKIITYILQRCKLIPKDRRFLYMTDGKVFTKHTTNFIKF